MKFFFLMLTLLGGLSVQAQTPPVKEWTFLVYLNADNNLYQYGLRNMDQMQKVGSTADMNMVVEFDPSPRGLPTQRLYIEKDQKPTVLQTFPETNMGDWKHFAEFVTWGIQNYPARHYAVIVWNHGDGWQGVSYDDNPYAHMTIPDLAQGLRQAKMNLAPILARRGVANGPLIDILNFDACLMSSLEVAYELKDLAGIMIGSQYTEPGNGEDYTAILAHLVKEPHLNAHDLAAHMVYEYVLQYPADAEINYLALDMSKVGAFTQMFRNVAAQHLQIPSPLQNQLRNFYANKVEGSDLIGGMTAARKIVTGFPAFTQSIDQLVGMYGYPAERTTNMTKTSSELRETSLKISRPYAAAVNFRASPNAAWQRQVLVPQADGTFAVALPKGAASQYVVQRLIPGTDAAVSQEALSTFMRLGENPIIFHNQFPATSPVIAEAHTARTTGAMGMSLYLGSLNIARVTNHSQVIPQILSQYMQLQFAKTGAPEWTQFMNVR